MDLNVYDLFIDRRGKVWILRELTEESVVLVQPQDIDSESKIAKEAFIQVLETGGLKPIKHA